MSKLHLLFDTTYRRITSSIAFYPALIATLVFLFSLLIMALEYQPFMLDLKEKISVVLVKSREDARLILSTLVGSMISLTVFSFSMVMIVLNRASSMLSPRVIPGLITNKANQVVLGAYLGTILFALLLVVSIQSPEDEYRIPSFGVFLAMLMAIGSLGLFVYFIHTISQSIHVDTILNRIYKATHAILDKAAVSDEESHIQVPDTRSWHTLKVRKVGYLKTFQHAELVRVCRKHDLQVRLREQVGFFYVNNYPYLDVSKAVDEDTEKALHKCFQFYPEDYLSDHYLFGFKQISEIAVKAMSPGINDPGTAVKAIDMLSVLFLRKMAITEGNCYRDSEGIVRVYIPVYPMEQLLYDNLTPIRAYGRRDAVVMYNLLESLRNLLSSGPSAEYRRLLCTYVRSMRDSCQIHINNSLDIDMVNRVIKQINLQLDGGDCLQPIELSEVAPEP